MPNRQNRRMPDVLVPDQTDDSTDNLVMRTVFLPVADDRMLREYASSHGVSKNSLIRDAVRDYIDHLTPSQK